METILLFVYGTLRLNGEANELMSNCKLEKRNFKLYGYSLYDHGDYPFAVKAHNNFIIGDIYSVTSDQLTTLDEYEGDLYIRVVDLATKLSLYVKKDNNSEDYRQIVSGNWFDRNRQNI